jgi:nicotinamidase-related amidase
MDPIDNDDPTFDLALSTTPQRVLDAVIPVVEVRQGVVEHREALAEFALASVQPVEPSAALRQRLIAAIGERPVRARKAVVVVDMIEDYLTPGRALFVPRAREIIAAVATRLEDARREGEPVVFVQDSHEQGDTDLEHWPLHAVEGTDGARIVSELGPKEGDLVVRHRTYSGFFETDLHDQLQRLGVGTLEITGCLTELQIFTTAADALMRGYRVEVPEHLQAGTSEEAERAALKTLSVMRPTPSRVSPH